MWGTGGTFRVGPWGTPLSKLPEQGRTVTRWDVRYWERDDVWEDRVT